MAKRLVGIAFSAVFLLSTTLACQQQGLSGAVKNKKEESNPFLLPPRDESWKVASQHFISASDSAAQAGFDENSIDNAPPSIRDPYYNSVDEQATTYADAHTIDDAESSKKGTELAYGKNIYECSIDIPGTPACVAYLAAQNQMWKTLGYAPFGRISSVKEGVTAFQNIVTRATKWVMNPSKKAQAGEVLQELKEIAFGKKIAEDKLIQEKFQLLKKYQPNVAALEKELAAAETASAKALDKMREAGADLSKFKEAELARMLREFEGAEKYRVAVMKGIVEVNAVHPEALASAPKLQTALANYSSILDPADHAAVKAETFYEKVGINTVKKGAQRLGAVMHFAGQVGKVAIAVNLAKTLTDPNVPLEKKAEAACEISLLCDLGQVSVKTEYAFWDMKSAQLNAEEAAAAARDDKLYFDVVDKCANLYKTLQNKYGAAWYENRPGDSCLGYMALKKNVAGQLSSTSASPKSVLPPGSPLSQREAGMNFECNNANGFRVCREYASIEVCNSKYCLGTNKLPGQTLVWSSAKEREVRQRAEEYQKTPEYQRSISSLAKSSAGGNAQKQKELEQYLQKEYSTESLDQPAGASGITRRQANCSMDCGTIYPDHNDEDYTSCVATKKQNGC